MFSLMRDGMWLTNAPSRFGYSTDTLINPTAETQEFTKCFDYMLLLSVSRGRMGWISYLKPDKEFDRSVATCRRFIDRYMAKAIADSKIKERPYIFLTELLESGASQEEIRQQLLSMIIGGRDTTAGTLSSLFWVLARRPDVYQKAREEVAVLGGEKPTWEDLKGLKYINMVIKESTYRFPCGHLGIITFPFWER
jgi:cytochrome P450